PVSAQLTMGEATEFRIGSGHTFPFSEAPLNAEHLKAFVLAPSGKRTDIPTSASGRFLSGRYTPTEDGMYRFVFVQDRGVMSQTTRGYLPGGKDKHPGARQSFRSFRSAVAYSFTPQSKFGKGQSAGIPFE